MEPILGKNHRFKTDSRSGNSESNPERQTQITNVSITIPRKQHSIRILLDNGKNFGGPGPCSPSRDGGGQIGRCMSTSSFDSPIVFLVIIKLCAIQAPFFIHG